MKKLVFLSAIVLSVSAMAELKVGTVNMMTLVRHHPNYEVNKNLLLSTEKDYEKRLDAMKAELEAIQEEGKKLADEYRNPMIAATAKAKIESDINAVQNKFMASQQKLRSEAMRNQQELSDLESRLLKAQAEDIRARVTTFAEKSNYDYIIDSTATIFSKKELDVTSFILKDMGVDPKLAEEKEAEDESK